MFNIYGSHKTIKMYLESNFFTVLEVAIIYFLFF